MKTADEALSREIERGMTREDVLRRAGALGIVISAGTLGPLTEAAFASSQIKRGGTFRQATAGGTTDFIDGQHIVAKSDIVRLVATFDALARFDEKGKIQLHLAEELKAEKANQYLIRVRKGVEFHNGKTLTIDDVIYSIKRTKNPKLKLFGNAAFGAIDLNGIKKLDKWTCRLKLSRPDVTLLEAFAQYFQGVVPKGYQPNAVGKGPLQYIGTGPFKVKSFTPGRESVHTKNENYWISGQPYFNEVRIINFPSDAAKVNALLSGQVEAMADVPFAQVPVVKGRGRKILVSPTGAWTPLCMRVDVPPFDDVRVRRAFRLLINRPQVDTAGPLRLRVRRQRHLLAVRSRVRGRRVPAAEVRPRAGEVSAQAGRTRQPLGRARHESRGHRDGRGRDDLRAEREGWRRQRHCPERRRRHDLRRPVPEVAVLGGLLGDAQLPPAGRDGRAQDGPVQRDALGRVLGLLQVRGALPPGPGTVDNKKRAQIIKDMQRMEYNDGGLIIWGFKSLTDGYSQKVGGYKVDRGTLNLNKYGNGFRTIYFV